MGKTLIIICFVFHVGIFPSISQDNIRRVMFYNVENLFDTKNDSLINDNEFTPEGERNWNNHRFYQKLNNLYKVIVGLGQWETPAIIGLCEIENRFVLNQLVYETPLRKFDYKVIHFDSPDQRGIDVSMLFRKGLFTKDTAFAIPIKFPGNLESKTRDILYVKGSFDQKDTIHLFVNHWPSRYGGYLETKPLREYVASVLKSATDSLFSINPYSKIVIMGDFNDGPYEESFANHLQSKNDTSDFGSSDLINLMAFVEGGTLKYQGGWDVFDQIIVSGAMLYEKGYQVQNKKANIYAPDFLMQEDEKYLGKKPFRTYNGFKYLGGFSDHLPVYVDIKLE